MRTFLPVLLFLLAASRFAGAEATSHWLQVKTDHFTVLTDSNERQARHTAGQLERMHNVFAKLLPNATDDPGSRIVVLAFRDRKGFQGVEPEAYLAKNSLDLAGLFLPRKDKSYILLRLDTSSDRPYTTVYHEYTHYMNRRAEFLPVWLNEGLAQFYQNTDILDKDVRLGQPDANDILFLRQQRLLPLDTLFSVDHHSPYYHEENKGNIFYAESWALTHMLFIEDFGTKNSRLRNYALYLAQGEGSLQAAQHAFGNLKQLQMQLDSYIRNGDYKLLTMALQNVVEEKDLEVAPVPNADADAIRADVLAENGRTREAQSLIEKVLAEAPQNAQAHESMGTIKLREGDMREARKWYGEAVALHTTSYLSFYYFGTLSMRDGASTPEEAATSLRQCLELNPKFAPAMIALAQFDTMHGEKLDEALQMNLRAVALDPANIDYRLNAAEVRLARKEVPSALAVLEATQKLAHTPEDRARVQARLERVQAYADQAARSDALRAEGIAEMKADASTPRRTGDQDVKDKAGHVLHFTRMITPDHKFPEGPPSGPKHTVTGTLKAVGCFEPKGLTLQVESPEKPVSLYSNDMYAISFTAGNFTPAKELNPCNEFEGMKAKVVYASVEDPTMAGQIVSMELSK